MHFMDHPQDYDYSQMRQDDLDAALGEIEHECILEVTGDGTMVGSRNVKLVDHHGRAVPRQARKYVTREIEYGDLILREARTFLARSSVGVADNVRFLILLSMARVPGDDVGVDVTSVQVMPTISPDFLQKANKMQRKDLMKQARDAMRGFRSESQMLEDVKQLRKAGDGDGGRKQQAPKKRPRGDGDGGGGRKALPKKARKTKAKAKAGDGDGGKDPAPKKARKTKAKAKAGDGDGGRDPAPKKARKTKAKAGGGGRKAAPETSRKTAAPTSANGLFNDHHRPHIKAKYPKWTQQQVTKKLACMWKAVCEDGGREKWDMKLARAITKYYECKEQ